VYKFAISFSCIANVSSVKIPKLFTVDTLCKFHS